MSTPYATPASQLGALVKEAREQRDLTQTEAAAQLGVTPRTLQNWERGSTPSAEHRRVVRRWLAVDEHMDNAA